MSYNPKLGKEIVDAVREGYSTGQIADLLGYSANYISTNLKQLCEDGSLVRIALGKYALPQTNAEGEATGEIIPPKKPSMNGHVVERDKRTVQLPEYMRTRAAITVFVEHSPEEIENVMRLELCIGDNWIPMPISNDMRLCVGNDIPRWSSTQEVYQDVKAYRLTLKNGQQMDYAHNPDVPLTLDRRMTT